MEKLTPEEIKKHTYTCKNCGAEYFCMREESECLRCGYTNIHEDRKDD